MNDHCGLRILAAVFLAGCTSASAKPETSARQEITAVVVDPTPGVVELTSAKAERKENIVYIDVAYRFTSGSPVKNYMLTCLFPGTVEQGLKPMESWELKPEGTIRTGIQVSDPTLKEFSITLSEADSPDRGYKAISNTITGEVP